MAEITEIDKIYDPDNNENVVLYNANDEPIEFEQIAIVPLNGKDYCILRPVTPFEGMESDEAIVFEMFDDGKEQRLDIVGEEEIIDDVFAIYNDLFAKAQKQKK